MTKKILDATCGSRTIWFNKSHPAAIYCDARDEEYTGIWKSTNRDSERTCFVHPDIQFFGHHSGKKSQTFWGCFMKLMEE